MSYNQVAHQTLINHSEVQVVGIQTEAEAQEV